MPAQEGGSVRGSKAGTGRPPAGIDALRFCRGCEFREDCVKFCARYFSSAGPQGSAADTPPLRARGAA